MTTSARTSRRGFLRLGLLAAALPLADTAPALAQTTGSKLKIGVVGAGRLGGAVGGRWVKAGHEVFFSSRHPDALKGLIDSLGPRAHAGTVAEAISFGDVILIAVPYAALPQIGRDNASALAGKIVLDACNPIASRDGEIAKEAMANGIGATSMKYLPGTRLVRAFNPVGYHNFEGEPSAAAGEKLGMPIAGDDKDAVAVASQLARDAGVEPVVVPLVKASAFAPGTPLFGKAVPASELRKQLGVAQ
ncbi:MAG TPA: NAD(P)-binding domain-containing protein [Hyphomicrobiaceae bacterium]|nr:NAD(P)-binding domain-containing protein [Hyphomicrobiaceae bacterium]